MMQLMKSQLVGFARRQNAKLQLDELKRDGNLHVILVGTGSPLPDPTRACACTVVIAGDRIVVVDAGAGAFARCREIGIPVGEITDLLITHFHSDHICEIGEFVTMSWATGGREKALPVHGPPGIEQLVDGFNQAYAFDRQYRVAHHSEKILPSSGGLARAVTIPLPGGKSGAMGASQVLDVGGLKVDAFNVDHRPVEPAYGFRFDYRGRSVVISGDTCKCDTLVRFSKDCDLLVTEACACHLVDDICYHAKCDGDHRVAKILDDVKDYHIENQDCIDIAEENNIPVLAMTHLVPPPRGNGWLMKQMWMSNLDMKTWKGRLIIGEDGMGFTLPPNSQHIVETHYLNRLATLHRMIFLITAAVLISLLL